MVEKNSPMKIIEYASNHGIFKNGLSEMKEKRDGRKMPRFR